MKKPPPQPKPKTAGRPTGGGALSKQRIAEAALAHIDEFGLGAFSMREIASQLSVYPATVHWHVSTREALLAEVAASVMAEVTPPPGKQTWQEWIAELFRRCRAAVRRHPNVAQLLGAQLVSNGSLPIALVEGVLAALVEAGFEGQPLLEAYNCVIAAMLGFVTMEFSPLPSDNTQAWAEELRERVHTIRPLDHPVLTRNLPLLANKAFIVRWDNGTTVPLDSSFERHIQITIDGLEAFARRVKGP
ncbi:TetR/AcrR family transcriptional regulator [Variovorax sp. OV700]|uniref:TetR/AcrR family transcriptional regulator n=1 Tax=Variovorax sp. OV700 TaxID=1882826 RepID=UPI0008894074|nr:TetR/AcrR family transcriptional regulator C-terminal domain-containing protein [Variovorax sp. OV700]SDI79273.1 transcriptional regulator, TetR family [Variovorax sp. OV700]